MARKKLDHTNALEYYLQLDKKSIGDMKCSFAFRNEKGELFNKIVSDACFAQFSNSVNDMPVGVYVHIIKTNGKVADFDQRGSLFSKENANEITDACHQYLKFITNKKKSPWRSLLSNVEVFYTDGRPYLIYIPITGKTHIKFLINFMAAVRAVWYNIGSVLVWYRAKKRGFTDYEALYLAMNLILTDSKVVIDRDCGGHFFHDPYNYATTVHQLKSKAPVLNPFRWDFSMPGYSSIWKKIGQYKIAEKSANPIIELLKDVKKEEKFSGCFKKMYLAEQKYASSKNSIRIDCTEALDVLFNTRNKWGEAVA